MSFGLKFIIYLDDADKQLTAFPVKSASVLRKSDEELFLIRVFHV